MSNEAMVVLDRVAKRFGAFLAVDDVSFEIRPGEIFGLLGPNGAGKTTTIRMILDLFRPDHGTITVFGGPVDESARRRIGYLPEERGLYQNERVLDCLVYLAGLKGVPRPAARRRAVEYLERVGLEAHARHRVKELSKGMQQKVQLGAALLHEPELVIIDEPFYGLDPVNTRLVKDVLIEARNRGAAIVMCTHQMDRVEELCERMGMFNQGRLVVYGDVRTLRRRWAPHAVVVRGRGDFAAVPGVERVVEHSGERELILADGVDPQAILRELALRPDVELERFEVATASLEELFIAVVEGRDRVERRSAVVANGRADLSLR